MRRIVDRTEESVDRSRCMDCGGLIGKEATTAVLTSGAPGRGELRGFLHSTVCAANWSADHVMDRDRWRMVEVV